MKGRKILLSLSDVTYKAVIFVVIFVLVVPFASIWQDAFVSALDVFSTMDVIDSYMDEMASEASTLEMMIMILIMSLIILPIIVVPFIGIFCLYTLIKGIILSCYAEGGWKSVEFGFKKYLTPHCRCKEQLTVRRFMISTSMPVIILVIIPAIVSLCTGSIVFWVLAIIFIISAWIDILIMFKLLKEDKNAKVIDIKAKDEWGVYILED